jgi:hypothetical protein
VVSLSTKLNLHSLLAGDKAAEVGAGGGGGVCCFFMSSTSSRSSEVSCSASTLFSRADMRVRRCSNLPPHHNRYIPHHITAQQLINSQSLQEGLLALTAGPTSPCLPDSPAPFHRNASPVWEQATSKYSIHAAQTVL